MSMASNLVKFDLEAARPASRPLLRVSELKKDLSTIKLLPIRVFSEVLAILVALVHEKSDAFQKLLYLMSLK